MDSLEIHRLTPKRLPDFLAFFDNDAFADNPAWHGCYCVYYHASDADWSFGGPASDEAARQARVQRHRDVACGLIESSGMQGFLAYTGGRVAGWCNAAPRESYHNAREYANARDATPKVGAV